MNEPNSIQKRHWRRRTSGSEQSRRTHRTRRSDGSVKESRSDCQSAVLTVPSAFCRRVHRSWVLSTCTRALFRYICWTHLNIPQQLSDNNNTDKKLQQTQRQVQTLEADWADLMAAHLPIRHVILQVGSSFARPIKRYRIVVADTGWNTHIEPLSDQAEASLSNKCVQTILKNETSALRTSPQSKLFITIGMDSTNRIPISFQDRLIRRDDPLGANNNRTKLPPLTLQVQPIHTNALSSSDNCSNLAWYSLVATVKGVRPTR